jgi:hypothetical protein
MYRNKVADHTYYAINTFVSLNCSFDWRQGLAWKRALGFNNSSPALPSLPNR